MGSRNPTAELVVAPRMVITEPTLSKGMERPALTTKMPTVAQKF